jgi:hypothetical protein
VVATTDIFQHCMEKRQSQTDQGVVPMESQNDMAHLLAPQPVKPRRRQRSIISLETFLGSHMEARTFAGSAEWPSIASRRADDSGDCRTPGGELGAGPVKGQTSSQDAVDELFQIMRRTSLGSTPPRRNQTPAVMRTSPESVCFSNCGFPSSPVARTTRNPIILNTTFQDMS